MYQWFIVGGMALIVVLLYIWEEKAHEESALRLGVMIIFSMAILGWVLVLPIGMYENAKNTQVFIQQQEYLNSYIPKDSIENAALTQKKVELNGWLYEAQYSKKTFGGFSTLPDTVLYLNPIQ